MNPAVTPALPPKRTVAVDQAESLPAASRARARSTCWPAANRLVSTLAAYGAVVSSLPIVIASIWNSTPATLSLAVAVTFSVPVSPLARSAGAVSVATGAWVAPPPPVEPPPPHEASEPSASAVNAVLTNERQTSFVFIVFAGCNSFQASRKWMLHREARVCPAPNVTQVAGAV